MAQLKVPIEFDHEDLQEMVEQAKREIAAACITKRAGQKDACRHPVRNSKNRQSL